MKFADVRRLALSLPEVAALPHFRYASFRVRGKIFVTAPADEQHVHIFVADQQREIAVALYPAFIEKLLWGKKVVGVRVELADAAPEVVGQLVRDAWQYKAPKRLSAPSSAQQG